MPDLDIAKVQTPSNAYKIVKNAISGTLGGIAVCLIGHPFDTLKVRLQTQSVANPVYVGLRDCFIKTLRWEGIAGLYKGVGSPLVGQMFFRATLFTTYFQSQEFFKRNKDNHTRLNGSEYFRCGMYTGFIVSFIEGPIDLFKSKMQTEIMKVKQGQPASYRNVFHCASVISQKYGIRGIYQALPAVCLRNIPSNAFYFGSFEALMTYMAPKGGTTADLSASDLLLSGGIAGFLYWFVTYPTDVIKSAMQADASEVTKRKYPSILQCIRTLYQEEGWKRFYRGFTPCLMRSIPANAVMLFVVQKVRVLLKL
ncbi:Mitochondrial substrate carrier family protein G [Trichoplax sp. H2]|nr:Mitochondrial substrate carrier family protein G [Trichoplax sp. H2]|eukprot:RDD47349.1 Mitochondrial substrate carrier family protein G [Trichoplax sp. H2]